jgi:putative component of toxin-antitoxin plasmid stabilization module
VELMVNKGVVAYKQQMPTVRMTETFATWLHDLRDAKTRSKIAVRIQRLANGNPGGRCAGR